MFYCKRPVINIMLLIVLSFLFAKLEINIEGNKGWAEDLPTWKKNIGGFVLTGYHLFLWLFLIVVFHIPFLFTSWTWDKEWFALSFLFTLLLLEDAFWFLLHDDFENKEDTWRNPKVMSIPYFFFIAGFFALFSAWKTNCKIWTSQVFLLLIFILVSYPFQVSSSPKVDF